MSTAPHLARGLMQRKPVQVGETFNRLTVLDTSKKDKLGRICLCSCSCGRQVQVHGYLLRSGNTQSCGCLKRDLVEAANKARSTHGEASGGRTPTYWTWLRIKQRCLNPKAVGYDRYGGAGVTVYSEWIVSYPSFLAHVGHKPGPHYELDRIDNDKGYEPGNCRWVTRAENAINRRSTRWVTIAGETKPVTHWFHILGVSATTYYSRLAKGLTPEVALTTPITGGVGSRKRCR